MFRSFIVLLLFPLSIQFVVQPVMAAPMSQVAFFYEIQSLDSILSFVTAATGSDRFEKESRELFKSHKVDLSKAFPGIGYDGNKVRFEGVADPVVVGATPYEFTYKGATYLYNPKKSVKTNFEEARKVWGPFKELSFPEKHAASGGAYVTLFSFVGVTATLAITGLGPVSYFGYKWYKNKTDSLKLECQGTKVIETKGKDRLVIETGADGQVTFFSEVNDKKELSGELEKITLRGKESYAITTGNSAVNDLRTADAVELNKNLIALKTLCNNAMEVEKFNTSAKRVQDAIEAGKIKVLNNGPGPSTPKDPDAVSGVIK